MADIIGITKLAISIVIIRLMELSIIKSGKTYNDYFEVAICILFGAWILREGW